MSCVDDTAANADDFSTLPFGTYTVTRTATDSTGLTCGVAVTVTAATPACSEDPVESDVTLRSIPRCSPAGQVAGDVKGTFAEAQQFCIEDGRPYTHINWNSQGAGGQGFVQCMNAPAGCVLPTGVTGPWPIS